jgi:hypothetical protein
VDAAVISTRSADVCGSARDAAMGGALGQSSVVKTIQGGHARGHRAKGAVDEEETIMWHGAWTRGDVIQGLTTAVLIAALTLLASGAAAAGLGPTAAPRDPEARRRWALARMDEMAQERLRCHERFRAPREVRDCQAEFERRHRAYNEIYIEAARQ